MKKLNFYKCEDCDYIKVEVVDETSCDGNSMILIEPNTVDAAKEKHVPVLKFDDNMLEVTVGEVLHPMSEEHLIDNIYVVTDNGLIMHKELKSTDEPKYTFKVDDAKKVDVYITCNLHGVWKASATR